MLTDLGRDGSSMLLLILVIGGMAPVSIPSNFMHVSWPQPRQHPDGARLHLFHYHLLAYARIYELCNLCSVLSTSNSPQHATLATSWSLFSPQYPQLQPNTSL